MHVPWQLATFAAALLFFHASEFALAAVFMRHELGWSSFLLSRHYCIAMLVTLVEFGLEQWLLPGLKQVAWVSLVGLTMVVCGEVIRKTAMLTAKGNFTHIIRRQRQQEHVLVTWGIYRYVRHPGYLGWSTWAVGMSLLLANPISTILFVVMVWWFFKTRIQYEEVQLMRMFPGEYADYRACTPTWFPLIP